jgi:predicted dehydrogenase
MVPGDDVRPLLIGIAGAGKIAREQHIPAIRKNASYKLAGCACCCESVEGVPNFTTVEEMLTACPDLEAIAICSPPQAHYQAAQLALQSGKHVLMEKPPCPTVMQLDHLVQLAAHHAKTLFQTWHLREMASVEAMQRWLASRAIRTGRITWKEDVRQWHPGQTWLWQTDGFGVFDAGINALSVLTKFFPNPILVKSADLSFPSNCQTPVAAKAVLTVAGSEITAEFDFRHSGTTIWEIEFETDGGTGCLAAHKDALIVDGHEMSLHARYREYPVLYDRFDQLIRERRCEVDKRPLKLVADMFMVGKHTPVSSFQIS